MRCARVAGIWTALMLGALAATSQATLVSFDSNIANGGSDTSIVNDTYASTNFDGISTTEVTGRADTVPYSVSRSLIEFDVSSLAGLYSSIDSLTLKFTTSYNFGSTGVVNVHQVSSAWAASQATFNDRLTGTPWTTAGGDFLATVLGSVDFSTLSYGPIVVDGVNQSVSVSLLPGGGNAAARQTLLNAWTGANNFGVLLKYVSDPGPDISFAGIRSGERATAAERPILEIEYTAVPEPSSFALLCLGFIGILSGRRRR